MRALPYLITNNSVTVTFDGETKTVMKDASNYLKVIEAIKEGNWDVLPGLLTPADNLYNESNGEMWVEDGQVYVDANGSDFAVPSGLNSTILRFMAEELPFKPLVKFAMKLSQNPSYRSVQQLFNFIEKHNFTITEDGNFIAYKAVKKDFTDCHTGTFDNSVGNVVRMERNQVNEDPNQVCSAGLHCANFQYASTFYSGGQLIYVEVNPKDVVSVPNDYEHAKIRVSEYKVLGLAEREFVEPIFMDSYEAEDMDESYKPSEDDSWENEEDEEESWEDQDEDDYDNDWR